MLSARFPSTPWRAFALGVVLTAGCSPHAPVTHEPSAVAPSATSSAAQAQPVSCGEPSGSPLSPRAEALPARLCVHVGVPADQAASAPATLVLAWYTPTELAQFEHGFPPNTLLSAFFERGRVVPGVRLGVGGLDVALDYPGGDTVVFVIADLHHTFWPTFFGGGDGNFVGTSKVSTPAGPNAAHVDLSLSRVPPSPGRPESCAGDRFELVHVDAPEVAGTSGNAISRRLCVWLPPSYATSPKRSYGVVYLLPGFASTDVAYLGGKPSLRTKADALAKDGMDEVILVGIDTSTVEGSTYLTNSGSGGQWQAFVEKRVVPEIDRRYRTRANAKGRAVVGHSTGGFNALTLALQSPQTFSIVAASAPDAPDFERWLIGDDHRVRPRWLAWTRLEAAVGGMGQMTSYAAAWSGVAPSEPGAFPFDLETGVLAPAAWARWTAHAPVEMIADAKRLPALRTALGGRIYLTVGKHDEFGLHDPTVSFSERLDKLGIAHELVETEGGHGSDQWAELDACLAFASRLMSPKTSPR